MNIIDSDSARQIANHIRARREEACAAQGANKLTISRLFQETASHAGAAAHAGQNAGVQNPDTPNASRQNSDMQKGKHFNSGHKDFDAPLDLGLPLATLHEIHAAHRGDGSSAAAFTLLMAERARMASQTLAHPMVWICESNEKRRQGGLYPPGLVELSINPDHLIYIETPNSVDALKAAAEAVRCAVLGSVIVDLAGRDPKGLDLTATRRLSLSAQQSGVTSFLLRSGKLDSDNVMPSAAYSRWEVASAPSLPAGILRDSKAIGAPAFTISLTRHRGGIAPFQHQLEWNRETKSFKPVGGKTEAASSGHNTALFTDTKAPATLYQSA